MSDLIYYTPGRFEKLDDLPDIKLFLNMFKIFNDNISFVDRTRIIQPPIKTITLDQIAIPTATKPFTSTFAECAIDRAQEIYQQHQKSQVPIRISWSGGIDSTVALMSFIELLGVAEAQQAVEIVMTSTGIVENPYVWERIIRPNKFKVVNTLQFVDQWNGDAIMVNGEGGDQVHGVDIYRSLIRLYGPTALTQPWTTGLIIDFIKRRTDIDTASAEHLAAILENQVQQAPVEIITHGDFWWWLNFSCKWASTFYRLITKSPNRLTADYINQYFFPFYNSEKFQLWSMYRREEKHQGSWATYKYKAKEFVCDVVGSNEYLGKHRQGSLTTVLSHTSRFEAIDSDFNFIDRINAVDWYEPNNSFKG